jgi:hypothetical protein
LYYKFYQLINFLNILGLQLDDNNNSHDNSSPYQLNEDHDGSDVDSGDYSPHQQRNDEYGNGDDRPPHQQPNGDDHGNGNDDGNGNNNSNDHHPHQQPNGNDHHGNGNDDSNDHHPHQQPNSNDHHGNGNDDSNDHHPHQQPNDDNSNNQYSDDGNEHPNSDPNQILTLTNRDPIVLVDNGNGNDDSNDQPLHQLLNDDNSNNQYQDDGNEHPNPNPVTNQTFTNGHPVLVDITNHISTTHEILRNTARRDLEIYTDKMVNQMNKKKKRRANFQIGDLVRVQIPKIDRFSIDRPTLPCKITEKISEEQYRIGCQFGTINVCYSSGELEPLGTMVYPELDEIPSGTLSIREAARLQSAGGVSNVLCNCKKSCNKKTCKCKKAGGKCTSRCHSGRSCANKN